ncbi:MAG: hypothetical protein JXR54_06005 [Tannerellaceae bacterium]|nr:hypothetical protein [Tannerellaceae bacterium]
MKNVIANAIGNAVGFHKGANLNQKYIEFATPNDGSTEFTLLSPEPMWTTPFFAETAELVLLADNLTENAVIANWSNQAIAQGAVLDGTQGQVMTKIKKLWYKEGFDASGNLNFLGVANYPRQGYVLHPKFAYGAGREHIYIGKYEGSEAGGKLQSISGVSLKHSISADAFHGLAVARGANWHGYDHWRSHLLQLLTYVYYGTYDIQSRIPGYTNKSSYDVAFQRYTGRSNILISHAGSVDYDPTGLDADIADGWSSTERKIANSFLWIENIFGHVWKFTWGAAADGRVASTNKFYATPDPSKFTADVNSILANYEDLGILLPGASNESYILNLQKGLMPRTQGGNSSTYITDYFWSYMDDAARDYLRVVLAGGPLYHGGFSGVAARGSSIGLSRASSTYGSRLCADP